MATLDSTTTEFQNAITALKSLTDIAIEAKRDVDKVAEVINKAAEAIGKVEKLVKNVAGVLAIL